MRGWAVVICVAATWLVVVLSSAQGEQIRINGHGFTLPEAFTVKLAAGPPTVERPISCDFDEQGRLYVSDASGTNENAQEQLAKKPHRIVRLEDTDGDGRFDRHTVFADKMMFPEGTMWYDGSLYVAAPPSIWKLTDTDGDGVADRREEWFKGQTLTGCANDLHGPYLGPDGWIYWCKGAFAKQTYERPGKKPLVTRAAHIFRARPDGTRIEPVMTGGMDNPVDVVFTPGGERIFSTTFLQNPGGGLRDGLIHAIYGGVYGKIHDVIDEHPRTGDVMPVLVHLGPAAPCGLHCYQSRAFGAEYQHNVFATLFNMRKVTRHVLRERGATFEGTNEDFLASDNVDFHPTDVIEDADGSLIVVDTGGWYKMCCPTSQLAKPDILGAVYRVRRKNAQPIDDARGLRIKWSSLDAGKLVKLLADSRPAVRDRATQLLAKQGAGTVEALTRRASGHASAEMRRNIVWTLTRIDDPTARHAVRRYLSDGDANVRSAAQHGVSLWRDRSALPELIRSLAAGDSMRRRLAAEALGRIGEREAVAGLLEAASEPADRALEHSLIYALIEIADPTATRKGLDSANANVRRTAMIAIDQMEGGELDPGWVAQQSLSREPVIKETAKWIIGRHRDWGVRLAGFFEKRLANENLSEADSVELERQLGQLARDPAIAQLLARAIGNEKIAGRQRRAALAAMGRSGVRELTDSWANELARLLRSDDPSWRMVAIAAARSLSSAKQPADTVAKALIQLAANTRLETSQRLDALVAMPGGLTMDEGIFGFLMSEMGRGDSAGTRATVIEALSKSRLNDAQLLRLCEVLGHCSAVELPRLLTAFERAKGPEIGLALVAALDTAPDAASSLRSESLRPTIARFGPEVQEKAEKLFARLDQSLAEQRTRLDSILTHLPAGDIRRGQIVFNGSKGLCNACHAIGYLGGNIGPDLTRIGAIRTQRDLVESIIFPSASFVRSYEPVAVRTTDGLTVNGVIRRDAADEVVIATGPKEERRIPRDEIEAIRPSTVSVMPGGLDQQLSPQELADVVEFLKAAK
jgi:putative membrane-bound dehydrogenase-like protein